MAESNRTIVLGDGTPVLVDASDYDYLNQWKWSNVNGYAVRAVYPEGMKGASYRVLMHRQVLGCPEKLFVDHINRNTLDNTKANLRVATASQNQWNRGVSKNSTSGHKGITWDKVNNKWRVSLSTKDKYHHIGRFDNLAEAVKARTDYITNLHGAFARQA